MNGNGGGAGGDPLAALAGGVDLTQVAVDVRRQLIVSPLQTQAEAIGADQLEISFLDTEGGEPIARTFRIGTEGIRAVRAALEALGAPPAPETPPGG